MFERSANRFPDFEAELQGICREIEKDDTVRFYTYVEREWRPMVDGVTGLSQSKPRAR
jgi:ornithine decarboxylase